MTEKNIKKNKTLLGWELSALIAALVILSVPLLYSIRENKPAFLPKTEPNTFAGSQSCKSCHETTFNTWMGSDHEQAMKVATEESVLGDFNNTSFTDPYSNITSRFYKKDGNFFVETEVTVGKKEEFQISHTFGFEPLQQYLIPFPNGKLQCLNIGWDTEKKSWYRLPPYHVENSEDWLHWSQGGQTWNVMCAECHSTQVKKNYDLNTEQYNTNWFEINVGCEACHGPASNHVSWAEQPALARKEVQNYDLVVDTGNIEADAQVTLCAPCHSRRFQLGDNDHSQGKLLDKLIPSLLEESLYHPDGQIKEEVYVWGSFTQSKMYNHDVRCSDCHDPHSTKPKLTDNDLCLQCHRASDYDTATHHFHKREFEGKPSDGHLCVKCHMPGQYFMGADYRPDHSLRIPRPDLSKKLNTPNSCSASSCHDDKPLDWVVENYTKWYGTKAKAHYGEIIADGRANLPDAQGQLIDTVNDTLLPTIVRATALSLLQNYQGEEIEDIFIRALNDEQDLIRFTAIHNLPNFGATTVIRLVSPKLYDPVKGVRIEAASLLAPYAKSLLRKDDIVAFEESLGEYKKAMEYNGDLAAQRYNLGNLATAFGNSDLAISHYQKALDIDDQFFPAKVNLATRLNSKGKNKEAVILLQEVLEENPDFYEIMYSLGLLLAEMNRLEEAAGYLGSAASGMPQYGRVHYNYGLALLKLQRWQEGMQAIEKAIYASPSSEEYFITLADLMIRAKQYNQAYELARAVLRLAPEHQAAKDLIKMLQNSK